jgi:hypothetical protein
MGEKEIMQMDFRFFDIVRCLGWAIRQRNCSVREQFESH